MITVKSSREIEIMREGGIIAAGALRELEKAISPGVTLAELDSIAHSYIKNKRAIPAFKGYQGFPSSICTSVNDAVVHGIPDKQKLNEGDVVSIDVGVIFKKYYSDTAITFAVGKVESEVQRLIEVTKRSLEIAISKSVSGAHLSDIGHAVQTYVESNGFSVVRQYVGHGIGRKMHEEPQIPNFGKSGQGPILKNGMVLALEPMVNLGGYEVKLTSDQWKVVTNDGKPSAHFEHTVAITEAGPVILTEL